MKAKGRTHYVQQGFGEGETCQYRRAITKSLITAQNRKKGTTPLSGIYGRYSGHVTLDDVVWNQTLGICSLTVIRSHS